MIILNNPIKISRKISKSKISKLKELSNKRNELLEKLRNPELTVEDRAKLLKRKFSIDDRMTGGNKIIKKLKSDLRKMYELKS